MERHKDSFGKDSLGNAGQSSVEFVLTFLLLLGFLLFFFQLTMMMAFGNFVHYATFMAARAYVAAGIDKSEQSTRATMALQQLVKYPNQPGKDRFASIGVGIGGNGALRGAEIGGLDQFQPTVRDFSWMEGVRYTFKGKLFLIPFAGAGKKSAQDVNSLTLVSESFLGREPTETECRAYLVGHGNGQFDNGC